MSLEMLQKFECLSSEATFSDISSCALPDGFSDFCSSIFSVCVVQHDEALLHVNSRAVLSGCEAGLSGVS